MSVIVTFVDHTRTVWTWWVLIVAIARLDLNPRQDLMKIVLVSQNFSSSVISILFFFYPIRGSFRNCLDIDECTNSPSLCGLNANCNNIEGSYACECETGYESLDGSNTDCTSKTILNISAALWSTKWTEQVEGFDFVDTSGFTSNIVLLINAHFKTFFLSALVQSLVCFGFRT